GLDLLDGHAVLLVQHQCAHLRSPSTTVGDGRFRAVLTTLPHRRSRARGRPRGSAAPAQGRTTIRHSSEPPRCPFCRDGWIAGSGCAAARSLHRSKCSDITIFPAPPSISDGWPRNDGRIRGTPPPLMLRRGATSPPQRRFVHSEQLDVSSTAAMHPR